MLIISMSGNYIYNKIARNLRNCCRSYTDNENFRRQFSLSARIDVSEKKKYTFKSIFELNSRKDLWEHVKFKCNEKLIILGEIVTKQCNFVAMHRIRRMSQVWNLYTSLYSEITIKQIFSQFAKNLRARKQPFSILLGASLFCWEKEKISDEEIQRFNETDQKILDEWGFFRISTCINELDKYRRTEDHPTKPISGGGLIKKLVQDGWEAVVQKDCVQVWRKAFPNSYLYEYKIMGTFYDVPARTFFAVQTDIEYRKKWDKLVIKLDVVDKENNNDGSCEVMHWVMHYPYPMYSREYVYIRRAVISPETNTMVLVSRAIDHPSIPVDKKYVRVKKYSSRMVIRPHRTYDENGFDYVLTYFDDPQAAFPAPAYNWMASSGVPDFVEKLHDAARNLHTQQRRSNSSPQKSQPSKESCTNSNIECIYM